MSAATAPEAEPAAIDYDRDLGSEAAAASRDFASAWRDRQGQRPRIGCLPGIQAGQSRRVAPPCRSRARDAERGDLRGKRPDRRRRQAAHLQAAARRHLDDAVAMPKRGVGQLRSTLSGDRKPAGGRRTARAEPVAGLHRRGERRAGAAARSGAFMPLRAPGPRRSARRDRRRPRCGADARGRAGAPRRSARRWHAAPPGSRAA